MSATDKYPSGLANSNDMLGRHLMDHPSTSLQFEADEELWLGRGPQSPSSINTFRDGPFRSEYSAYRLDFTNISQVHNATQALIKEGVYGPELERQLRHRAAHQMSLKNVLEVLPKPENRITLSDQKDAMGIPKPQAHYAIDEYTRKGAEVSKSDFARVAELMGGTKLQYSTEGYFANNQHICGTLSMGTDAGSSVVDQFGRAHEHENLFMVGTGVLPTAGTCNSTETALAVALRTVAHIVSEQPK
jgi:choline dehydrogenase-like flavoprotein